MDQRCLTHHLLDLVALEMADEVQRHAVISVFSQLLGHLLDPIFPQHVDTGSNGLSAGSGVIHFAGTYQGYILPGAAGLGGSQVNLPPDGGNIFGNRHGNSSFIQL